MYRDTYRIARFLPIHSPTADMVDLRPSDRHYTTYNLADAFIQSNFQLSAFNPVGANSRQQVVSASTRAI